ncbi:MAG: hypothetical protein PHW60_11310 [Kiritimatiellae bacterium]|nr:hypothetical protein [Kiritimatiellia bacterium]
MNQKIIDECRAFVEQIGPMLARYDALLAVYEETTKQRDSLTQECGQFSVGQAFEIIPTSKDEKVLSSASKLTAVMRRMREIHDEMQGLDAEFLARIDASRNSIEILTAAALPSNKQPYVRCREAEHSVKAALAVVQAG